MYEGYSFSMSLPTLVLICLLCKSHYNGGYLILILIFVMTDEHFYVHGALRHVWLFATLWTCSLPGSSVHGTLQAGILERPTISFSRGSSLPKHWNHISNISCIVPISLNILTVKKVALTVLEIINIKSTSSCFNKVCNHGKRGQFLSQYCMGSLISITVGERVS